MAEIDYEAFTNDFDGFAFGAGDAASGSVNGGTHELGIVCIGTTGDERASATLHKVDAVTGDPAGLALQRSDGTCGESPTPQTTRMGFEPESGTYLVESTSPDGANGTARLTRHTQ